jgi:hypothetical protein
MANVKISALPSTTATTFNDWLVKNDSGETTTSKIQLKNVLGMTSLNGANAIQSSSWLTSLGTTASTQSAIAIGNGAEATSPYSIAIGYEAFNSNRDGTRDYYICIGFQTRAVQGATAIGKNAQALGADATSIGQNAITSGNGGFALGNNSLNQGTNGVAIGTQAEDYSNNGGVAIGYDTRVNHDYAVSLGSGITSLYSATTHTNSLHTYGQTTTRVQSVVSGITFSVNADGGGKSQLYLTGASTIDIVNVKDGSSFLIKTETDGNHTIGWTASGYTFLFANGTSNPGNNVIDIFRFEVFGSVIYGERIHDFS